eukprot:g2116.t1
MDVESYNVRMAWKNNNSGFDMEDEYNKYVELRGAEVFSVPITESKKDSYNGFRKVGRKNDKRNVSSVSSAFSLDGEWNPILKEQKTRIKSRKRKNINLKTSLFEGWMIRQHRTSLLGSATDSTSNSFKRHYFVLLENGKLEQYDSRVSFLSSAAYPELVAELKNAKFLKIYSHSHLPHNGFELNFGFESIWLCPESLTEFEVWYEKLIIFTEERLTSLRENRTISDNEVLSTNITTLVLVGNEGALVRPGNARDTGSGHFWYAVAVYYYDMLQDPQNLSRITAYRQFQLTDPMHYLTDGRNVNASFGSHIPSFRRVYSFLMFIRDNGNPAAYSAVTCLALMIRMCKDNGIGLHTDNWQQFFLATLNVAHKSRNGGVNLENIDDLWYNTDSGINNKQSSVFEWQCMTNLNFKVEVSSIEYGEVLQKLKNIETSEPRNVDMK